MARYVSSYHSSRKKQIITRILIVSGILIFIAVVAWAFFGRDRLKSLEQKPVVVQDSNKPIVAEPKTPQTSNNQPAATVPGVVAENPMPKPTDIANPAADELIKKAFSLANSNPIEARDILNSALEQIPMSSQQTQDIKNKMASLSEYWLFSRKVFPNDPLCGTYTVKSGDMLIKVAPNFKVPYEILMQVNNIQNASSLIAGQNIKIINGPFHVKVHRSTFTADLYLQNTYVRSFKAGLGIPGRETPTGFWVVKYGGKAIQPQWTDDETKKNYKAGDPDYPLGTRWIELQGLEGDAVGRTGIAFHGTNEDNSIGTLCSRGCVRMHNSDVELLYKLLEPGSSNVRITD